MTEYLTEQEQVEMLKNWIKQYSMVIFISVLLTIVFITGWRYWQTRQSKTLSHASSVYDEMLTMRARNDADATVTQASKLLTHYNKTIYGDMALLMLARNEANNKDFASAEKHLYAVIKSSDAPSFQQIARIRLARVLITDQKPEESLKVLNKVNDETFAGLIDEVKGDAYVALKNNDMAKQAYQSALNELPNADVMRPLLRMKYDNLVTSP